MARAQYITCKINRFQFRAEPNPGTGKQLEVNVSTYGLTPRIPVRPEAGIRCDSAPDVTVEDPGLKPSLRMAKHGRLTVIAKGELDGRFSMVLAGESSSIRLSRTCSPRWRATGSMPRTSGRSLGSLAEPHR